MSPKTRFFARARPMDTILLTTRFGATRHLVRVDKASLSSWASFRTSVTRPYTSLSPDAPLSFYILMPSAGGDLTRLTEVEICDVADLSALR